MSGGGSLEEEGTSSPKLGEEVETGTRRCTWR